MLFDGTDHAYPRNINHYPYIGCLLLVGGCGPSIVRMNSYRPWGLINLTVGK